MEKEAYFQWIWPLITGFAAGGTLGSTAGYHIGASGKADLLKKIEKLEEEKNKNENQTFGSPASVGGALLGGTTGFALGPKILPDLDPSSARLAGGTLGTIGGALAGPLISNMMRQK